MDVSDIPYTKGTKSFIVAQRFIAGERDNRKISQEVNMNRKTVSGIKTYLRRMGLLDGRALLPLNAPPAPVVPPAPQNVPPLSRLPHRMLQLSHFLHNLSQLVVAVRGRQVQLTRPQMSLQVPL